MNRWLLMWVLLAPPLVMAAEVAEAPSLELLEFLGNWETEKGEWLDPMELIAELDALEADAQSIKVKDGQDEQ